MKKIKTEYKIMEILGWFLYQDDVRKAETDNGLIKVYKVGDNLIRIDIKIGKEEIKKD